ncbi:hypothetical protein BDZ85DRAFT_280617 [Elsinoe ampelina]|uniref:Nucleotide-diphospho-sugar transferase n=1 Tax=Elsinoe ampelina TaxID=302913 RepID=A0A6A6GEB6_9PEZI|nr:hypothetical protein BDZ85DRAFT_280617 [Elsinoe ampelina]
MVFAAGNYVGKNDLTYTALLSKSASTSEFPTVKFGGAAGDVFDVLRSLPPVDLLKEYGITEEQTRLFPKPLKEKICILNTDSRPWDSEDMRLDKMKTMESWGSLNHYLYATLHGYTYKHVQTPQIKPLFPSWGRLPELYRLTKSKECQYVVYLDEDLIFKDLRVPLEPMMSYWNITSDIALAAGLDLALTKDEKNRTALNSGLVITQDTPQTNDLFRDWIECPFGKRYPHCKNWVNNWANEQSGLTEFVRYDYEDVIRELPLEETHQGKFMFHYWGQAKSGIPQGVRESIANRFIPEILERLAGSWSQHHEVSTRPYTADSFVPL